MLGGRPRLLPAQLSRRDTCPVAPLSSPLSCATPCVPTQVGLKYGASGKTCLRFSCKWVAGHDERCPRTLHPRMRSRVSWRRPEAAGEVPWHSNSGVRGGQAREQQKREGTKAITQPDGRRMRGRNETYPGLEFVGGHLGHRSVHMYRFTGRQE